MTNNKQQTAVDLYRIKISILTTDLFNGKISGQQFLTLEREYFEQAKEMDKEQTAVEIQKFIDKVNEKIDRELGWCGGPRNKSAEMENWRKAYADVRKWMQNLNKEFQQTYESKP